MTASWAGIGLGVVSGLCYASYTVFGHYGLAHYESYTMIYWTFLVAGLGSVLSRTSGAAAAGLFRHPKGIIGVCCVVIVGRGARPISSTRRGWRAWKADACLHHHQH